MQQNNTLDKGKDMETKTEKLAGLLCSVLVDKKFGDCSNGGLSSKHSRVILLGVKYFDGHFEAAAHIFSPTKDTPPVVIEERRPCGRQYFTAYPCDENGNKLEGWYMFGGCYIKDSDSRFPFQYPIPLHDRQE